MLRALWGRSHVQPPALCRFVCRAGDRRHTGLPDARWRQHPRTSGPGADVREIVGAVPGLLLRRERRRGIERGRHPEMRRRFSDQAQHIATAGLRAATETVRTQVPESIRHHVPLFRGLLQRQSCQRLFAAFCQRSEIVGRIGRLSGRQAANAAFALSTMASNAAGSWMARSESTLRSTVTPALPRPEINRL
jgi:hypothetical protein